MTDLTSSIDPAGKSTLCRARSGGNCFPTRLEAEIPYLLRRARALTRNDLLARDLVQDCLLRALSKKHLWQEGTNLRAWLSAIMRNLLIDNRRRHASEGGTVALSEIEFSLRAKPTQDSKLELRDLNRALIQLPEEMRTALLLVGLDGLSYTMVAKILRIPVGTVCSRVYRGREELRRALG
jgi:RNA polymerase sigma-70 factor (ECF subfamily)